MSESKLARRRFSVPEKAERRYITGLQTLPLASVIRSARDKCAGLNTAGVTCGYHGSPLGTVNKAYEGAERVGALKVANVTYHPGLNEELAADVIWGTQQLTSFEGARRDGVFGMWYGKGPGLDRASDAIKHANAAGVSRFGGVVAVCGDDHGCKSSTIAHQSEYALIHLGMPILAPSSVQEMLDFTLLGWDMSRFSGAWVGLKVLSDICDASATVSVDTHYPVVIPDVLDPTDHLHLNLSDKPLDLEAKKVRRLEYAKAFGDANNLNKVMRDIADPCDLQLGIAAVGRAYTEVMEALALLGINEEMRQELGIVVCKIGMPWPLSIASPAMKRLIQAPRILVVEEKAGLVEDQLKKELFGDRANVPAIFGKFGHEGAPLLSAVGTLTAAQVAVAITKVCFPEWIPGERFALYEDLNRKAEALAVQDRAAHAPSVSLLERVPHYCSGCPHSRSTKIPEGATALIGIGCHYMAQWMPDRPTVAVTQMGGEGTPLLGWFPFSDMQHVFVNMGDGTYSHSGSLAIRALVAGMGSLCPDKGVTVKLLVNEAVAMTGGQVVEGKFTVPQITRQLAAEGVETIVVVAEDPDRYDPDDDFPQGVSVHPREDLDEIMKELQEVRGVSILLYDQECAAQKRRKRKRGALSDPPQRVLINERVCEGCGDCSKKSNCLSIEPLETRFGTKRKINQSSCNKDYSCKEGFCPSFVLVDGAVPLRRRDLASTLAQKEIPEPVIPVLTQVYNILLEGIGGTGVVTVDNVICMAAYLDGLAASGLSLTGLSQKYGAVSSHVRIAPRDVSIFSTRIPWGSADLLIGYDPLTATGAESLAILGSDRSHAVINRDDSPTAEFIHHPEKAFAKEQMLGVLRDKVGKDSLYGIEAASYAAELFGDGIATNFFLVGYAYQLGLIPIKGDAIREAISLNGVDTEMNLEAFACGRYAAAFPEEFAQIDWWWKASLQANRLPSSQEDRIRFFESELVAYQGRAYADRYLELVRDAQALDRHLGRLDSPLLTEAVIRYFYKLLAYKDEYEVARLYTDGAFERQLKRAFGDDHGAVSYSLAPPSLGTKKKMFGPWMFTAMRVLARFKFLRGTWLDPFAYKWRRKYVVFVYPSGFDPHRKEERELIRRYESLIAEMAYGLNADNYDLAVQLLSIPEEIRGYGHIKQASIEKAKPKAEALLRLFREKVKMT